jgi:lysophospholipase L1-like esterase
MKINKKKASFSIVLVLLVIGFLEATLGLLAFVSPRVDQLLAAPGTPNAIPHIVPDERLGGRPNPAYPGHDRKGFRNPEVPAKVHIVALGDSQTYGTGVKREDAWPRQLESVIGRTVYSMAFGGYGPVHSLILWDEAVALSSKIVIEAFYAGNDLFNSFDLVYNQEQLPELKSSDPQLQATVREAEQSESIAKRVSRMFKMGTIPVAVGEEATAVTGDDFPLRRLLSQHSKIYGLLRRARYERWRWVNKRNNTPQANWEKAKAFAEAHPAYCQIFNNGQFRTVFTSEYRLSALDLGDPRIAEGLRISLAAIQKMKELAATRNIQFIVLLIPTKETVFRKLWLNSSMSYRSLTENEERFWRLTKDFLEQNGIEYLDALPVLQGQLTTGIQPYQVSHDGHPNEYGHKAIAKLVAAYIESLKAYDLTGLD